MFVNQEIGILHEFSILINQYTIHIISGYPTAPSFTLDQYSYDPTCYFPSTGLASTAAAPMYTIPPPIDPFQRTDSMLPGGTGTSSDIIKSEMTEKNG